MTAIATSILKKIIGENMLNIATAGHAPATFGFDDPLAEEDDGESVAVDKVDESEIALFDGTEQGNDALADSEIAGAAKKKTPRVKSGDKPPPLAWTITDKVRIKFHAREYVATKFDTEPRQKFSPPQPDNDNLPKTRKHSFPALDEARNNTLMDGRTKAEKLFRNEWAFDILIEVQNLMNAAAPRPDWLSHNGHGDEFDAEKGERPGYSIEVRHCYGPTPDKMKKLWEAKASNDNKARPRSQQASCLRSRNRGRRTRPS